MPSFVIEATDINGKKYRTKIAADSSELALNKVRTKGLTPTSCKELKDGGPQTKAEQDISAKLSSAIKKKGSKKILGVFSRVPHKQLIRFTQQLSVLLGAGLPIVRCIRVLSKQQPKGPFKEILTEVAEDIESGSSLSEALGKHNDVFDRLYVNMVKAGEAGGVLDEIMRRLADYHEKIQKLKAKMVSASLYPVIVLLIAVVVVLAVMTLIVPKFKEVLSQLGGEGSMHPLTELILGASAFIISKWYLLIVMVICLGIATFFFFQSKKGKELLDKSILKIPFVGNMVRKFLIARICRTFGTLLKSGVPILEAITILKNTSTNIVVENTMGYLYNNVKEGESLTGPLSQSKIFDDLVVSMVDVGEETGELDNMLLKIADTHDMEVDAAIAALSSLIEPILILILGGIVGVIVLALFLPLMGIIKTFGSQSGF